jgi:hypothetical protein
MSDMSDTGAALDAAIDAIEGGYEFLLAYAAQGRRSDREGQAGQELRARLQAMAAALDQLAALARAVSAGKDPELTRTCAAYFDAVERDAAVALAAIGLVLAQAGISSQLIDNLNASIHLRAVLTDIFLIDEALKPRPPA